MTKAELFERVMKGEFFIVGEYRGGAVEKTGFVDRKSGLAALRVLITYAVECTIAGKFGNILIRHYAPAGVTSSDQVQISLVKAQTYGFQIQSLKSERNLIMAWLGPMEPALIDA